MNPDLYACLPPDKKKEYKKLFPEPIIDYTMSAVHTDDCVPCGYAFLRDRVFKLPDAQTYTSTWSDENANPKKDLEDLVEEINNSIDEVESLKKYPVFVEGGRPLSPLSTKLRGFARWRGEALIVPVKKDEAFFIDFENPMEDSEDGVLNKSIENKLKDDLEKQLKDYEEKELIREVWFGL